MYKYTFFIRFTLIHTHTHVCVKRLKLKFIIIIYIDWLIRTLLILLTNNTLCKLVKASFSIYIIFFVCFTLFFNELYRYTCDPNHVCIVYFHEKHVFTWTIKYPQVSILQIWHTLRTPHTVNQVKLTLAIQFVAFVDGWQWEKNVNTWFLQVNDLFV